MSDLAEAILLHNWLKESDAMESNDYGFLLNLFLEINHAISECPNTPDGRHITSLLQKQSNKIGNRIEMLEDHIDVYVSEYFEATPSEASEWEVAYEDFGYDKRMRKEVYFYRDLTYTYSWTVDSIVGPTGTLPDDLELDELDEDAINSFVVEWAEGTVDWWSEGDKFGNWDDPEDTDSFAESEMLEYEFESEIRGRKFSFTAMIEASVELTYESAGSEDQRYGWQDD